MVTDASRPDSPRVSTSVRSDRGRLALRSRPHVSGLFILTQALLGRSRCVATENQPCSQRSQPITGHERLVLARHFRFLDSCCGSGPGAWRFYAAQFRFHGLPVCCRPRPAAVDLLALGRPARGQESNATTGRLATLNLATRGTDCDLGHEYAASSRRDLHADLKAGRHVFPETICRQTMPLLEHSMTYEQPQSFVLYLVRC